MIFLAKNDSIDSHRYYYLFRSCYLTVSKPYGLPCFSINGNFDSFFVCEEIIAIYWRI